MSGPVNGVMTELEAENARLRDEVARLTAERDVSRQSLHLYVRSNAPRVDNLHGQLDAMAAEADALRARVADLEARLKRPDPYEAPMVGERLAARPDVAAALVDDTRDQGTRVLGANEVAE